MSGRPFPKIHGESNSVEYRIWGGLKNRCDNPNNKDYFRYGGRGIKVCDRWQKSYLDFLADVGRKPSPQHSLDRIDNNGNYEPGNVRWATLREQNRNRRDNRLITFNGVTRCIKEWAEINGIYVGTLACRLNWGWPIEDAFIIPAGYRGPVKATRDPRCK